MYSFDVFDTLITRTTATPKGIFALMQERLAQHMYDHLSFYIRNNFYELRIHAEELARVTAGMHGEEDVDLEQIYDAMAMTEELSVQECEELITLELEIEYENSLAIQSNIDRVHKLLERGENVILISDMYLKESEIRRLLVKADDIFEEIPIYVSSEYKANKASGKLFQLVKNMEDISYSVWTHTGDNEHSDIEVAQKLGIHTVKYDYPKLLPIEYREIQNNPKNNYIQQMIGWNRYCRGLNPREDTPWLIGCVMGGMILYPYVEWILQTSIRKEIKNLYFIARDGYVLKTIADQIIAHKKYDIQTYYLYGSRKAWRMPAFSKHNQDIYKYFQWSHVGKIHDMKGFSEVFAIEVEELLSFLPIEFQKKEIQLTNVTIYYLVQFLNKREDFKEFLIRRHAAEREIVQRYLQQEIDFTDSNFAFVDLSGGGFTQGCLADIIADFYKIPVATFFFEMDRMHVMDNCNYYVFAPSHLKLNIMIEMLCRAPHGQTMGYIEVDGHVVPIFNKEGKQIIKHGFEDYLEGVKAISQTYAKNLSCSVIRIQSIIDYMEYLTRTPDEMLLNYFGDMPNSETGRESEVIEFAPKLSLKQLKQIYWIWPNRPITDFYKGSSLDYSLLRCTENEKKKIHYYTEHQNDISVKLIRRLSDKSKMIKESGAKNYPLEILHGNILLYGAGKLGQGLFNRIKKYSECQVVQWIDYNYKKFAASPFPVTGIDSIGQVEYDQLVIAIVDETIARNIRKMLVVRGVPIDKIVWINYSPRWE